MNLREVESQFLHRQGQAALDGGEGLDVLEVDLARAQTLCLLNLVPVEHLKLEVGTCT